MIGRAAAEHSRLNILLSSTAVRQQDADPRDKKLLHSAFRYSGYSYREQRKFYRRILLGLAIAALTGIALNAFTAIVLVCILCVAWQRTLARRIRERSKAFESQYTAFLVSLASSIRAGHDPLSAIGACEKVFPDDSVMYSEIKKFQRAIAAGEREEEAIWGFAADIQHPDISFFRMAIVLARRQGASLGETLHRLTRVTRLRQSFRRRVKAALAMQRMSAVGISVCAILVAILQAATNPTALIAAWNHSIGRPLLIVGVGLIGTGLVWMLRLARERL